MQQRCPCTAGASASGPPVRRRRRCSSSPPLQPPPAFRATAHDSALGDPISTRSVCISRSSSRLAYSR